MIAAWSARERALSLDSVSNAEEEYRVRLGKAIVQLRALRNLSQAGLAERVHRSEAAVSRWETGKVTPSAFDLVQLAEALDAPAGLLLAPPELPLSPVAAMLREVAERAADVAVDEALGQRSADGAAGDRGPLPRRLKQ